MPRLVLKTDTLNARNMEFDQRPLAEPVFLNSVPKCGTHLLRNIVRMFVPVQQQYHDAFVQHQILQQHKSAFDTARPKLSWGHLAFSDDAAILLRRVHHVVQVRDPFDWVLARARFFLSDEFRGPLEHLKGGNVDVEELLNMMIFGVYGKAPSMHDLFTYNAVAWLGTGAYLLHFEELLEHAMHFETEAAGVFFARLMERCGIGALPEDWRERVRIGADREQSGTARENLAGDDVAIVPDELPEKQKELVEFAVPGLRRVLGYD